MSLKIGITRFWGTNCDYDIKKWVELKSFEPQFLWFEDRFNVNDYDMLIIPGGFSYGDYLRCGALAAKTPVMNSVAEFAKKGKPVLGICNGFQILCEAGLLPGVLLKNDHLKFKDDVVALNVKQNQNAFFKTDVNKITLPIAHGDGRYYANAETLKQIYDQDQVWLTYENNPNGSLDDIAGITNKNKNICGLMPHPERALFNWMGSTDGMSFLC